MRALFLFFFLYSFTVFAAVDPALLSEKTQNNFKKVLEFDFIIQEANKLGVKVYLFGGTASAFAHYVRWDLERKAGDTKYQKERFDYDFTNIYRGNQDLDIVVDGTPSQADQLKSILQTAFPHFIGDRTAWEVRLLSESRGDKGALLGDEDFKKQHSDTNSTGMLLLNPDPQGIVYNDLLNWGSPESDFLNDVAAARIKFLFSDEHEETQRFKDGKNPPVLAAIRYLAKLAQYEVTGTEKDLEIVTQIIAKTDFTKLSAYGKKKAEEFALKTLLNAPDSEYAWNLLDDTGARSKLIEMDGALTNTQETLSWWLSKEPLRTFDFGSEGITAREIFGTDEIIVSHETKSFKAYDNITRSSKGGANAFISRQGVVGEAAALGDGFYTKIGQAGARGTGLTIRFKLHPDAREGVDFQRGPQGYIVVKNKKALTLIQENLNLDIKGFFKLILGSDIDLKKDKGLIQKFIRKFTRTDFGRDRIDEVLQALEDSTYIGDNFPEDKKINFQIDQKLETELKKNPEQAFHKLIEEVLLSFINYNKNTVKNFIQDPDWAEKWEQNPAWVEALIDNTSLDLDEEIIRYILVRPYWAKHPELLEKMINKPGQSENIAMWLFSKPHWSAHPQLMWKLIKKEERLSDIISTALAHEHWSDHSAIIEYLLDNYINLEKYIVRYVFPKPLWLQKHTQLLIKIIKKYKIYVSKEVVTYILTKEHSVEHSEILELLIENGNVDEEIISDVFSKDFWSHRTDLVEKIINRNDREVHRALIQHALSKPFWIEHPQLMRFIAQKKTISEDIATYILSQKEWAKYPDILETLIDQEYVMINGEKNDRLIEFVLIRIAKNVFSEKHWAKQLRLFKKFVTRVLNEDSKDAVINLIRFSLSKPHWMKHHDIINKVIEKIAFTPQVIEFIFSHEYWVKNPDFLENFMKTTTPQEDSLLVKHVFSRKHWVGHTYLLERLIEKGSANETIAEYVFSQEHWAGHLPLLEKLIEKKSFNFDVIIYVLSKKHWMHNLHLIKRIVSQEERAVKEVIRYLFSNRLWEDGYKVLFWLMKQGKLDEGQLNWIFQFDHWQKHSLLKKFMDNETLNSKNFVQKFNEKNYIDFLAASGEISCQMLLE